MEFLHFYSDYFANILCENENQKNILALLALLGTSEHQAYYRIPTEIVSERTSEIIDNLPSLRTDCKAFQLIEDLRLKRRELEKKLEDTSKVTKLSKAKEPSHQTY